MTDYIDVLRRVEPLRRDRNRIVERLEQLRSAAEGLTRTVRDGSAGTAEPDKMAKLVAEMEEVADQLSMAEAEYAIALGRAETALRMLPDKQRDVVRLREVDQMSWDAVADAMHYSRAQCYRYHEKARDKLRERGYSAG